MRDSRISMCIFHEHYASFTRRKDTGKTDKSRGWDKSRSQFYVHFVEQYKWRCLCIVVGIVGVRHRSVQLKKYRYQSSMALMSVSSSRDSILATHLSEYSPLIDRSRARKKRKTERWRKKEREENSSKWITKHRTLYTALILDSNDCARVGNVLVIAL